MKKMIGLTLIFLGGLFCINGIIFIPAVFFEDGWTWGERITVMVSFMVLVLIGGTIFRIGFRILTRKTKRSISQGNLPAPAAEERDVISKKDAAVSEVRYKYVYVRDGIVSNGKYKYRFDRSNDLFTEEKDDYAYPELPWNFRKAANIGKHVLDMGGLITRISICGGCSEIYHTGTVAYRKAYGSLDAFVENSMRDIEEAEEEARMMYGSWFSGLDYKDIIIFAKIKETEITVDVSCFVHRYMVEFRLGNGSDGFVYLTDLVHQFGARDYDQGIGADRICWDPALKIFRRIYQLEESRTYFLSSYMDEEGNFKKYSFDVELAKDSHYEIFPEKMERLMQILKDEMNQKYIRNPAVGCAEYLQNHSGLDLIELLEKYQLTENVYRFG